MRNTGGYGSTSSSIDNKLANENCDIDSLLEEDEVIQEMKYQNQKLIN